jgi:hypothetical protein
VCAKKFPGETEIKMKKDKLVKAVKDKYEALKHEAWQKVDSEYARRGISGSGIHKRARGLVEVRLQAEMEIELTKLLKETSAPGVSFSLTTGNLVLITKSGETYEGNFRINSQNYIVLEYLLQRVGKTTPVKQIAQDLDLDDEQVTNVIKYVNGKLDLRTEDSLFEVNNGYGIRYKVTFL